VKQLRVPQREIQAEILLYGGQRRRGRFYVPASGPDGGPGRLIDRLNDASEGFLALAEEGSGCLVSKQRIVCVELVRDEHEVELTGDESRVAVRIELAAGPTLEGEMPYAMPPDKSRLIDYLNAASRFIHLLAGERLMLVNRDFLTTVNRLEDDTD